MLKTGICEHLEHPVLSQYGEGKVTTLGPGLESGMLFQIRELEKAEKPSDTWYGFRS